jgi:hypothetical protein
MQRGKFVVKEFSMRMGKVVRLTGTFCLLVLASASAHAQAVPQYKPVAPWPKPLPDNWMLANAPAMAIDKNDHIWIAQRPRQLFPDDAAGAQTPPFAPCCVPAPSIIEFDAEGNVLKSFGGPNYLPDWPIMEHGLFIDGEGNFWLGGNYQGGNGNGLTAPIPKPKDLTLGDRQELKIDPTGTKVLLEIGHPSAAPMNNQDTSILGAPAEVFVDDAAHEVYIADGYLNRRVVVYDSNTGAFKRGWGAYGMPLSEISNDRAPAHDPGGAPDKQFRGTMNSVDISVDGLVYVADRGGDRIQIFTKEGKFVKEFMISPKTTEGSGTVWSTMFSRDPKQKFLYVADGTNGMIRILTREDGMQVGTIGHKGHMVGEFDSCERMGLDSHGNLYVTEVNHNTRLQKFAPVK